MNVLYPRTFISSLLKDIQGAYRGVILRNLFKKITIVLKFLIRM